MDKIKCIYCGKINDLSETTLLKEKQNENDSQVRQLECKKCEEKHTFFN